MWEPTEQPQGRRANQLHAGTPRLFSLPLARSARGYTGHLGLALKQSFYNGIGEDSFNGGPDVQAGLQWPIWSSGASPFSVSNGGSSVLVCFGLVLSSLKMIMGSTVSEYFFTQEVFTKCLLLTQKVLTKCLLFI